ncbi:MFS transporter [Streptomyces sp. NPDC046985]|uniref:MFS transporter n=1 Tax=Streptomyces sp. NPDC046985 TaxID=3155377 RepID=UPI00340B5DD7
MSKTSTPLRRRDKTSATEVRQRGSRTFWLVAAVYVLAMLGGTLPVPLYLLWAPRMGFGPLTTTLIFAVYAIGVVVSLMLFASMSDRSGRRPLLFAALALAAVSTVAFLLADDVMVLLAARLFSGLATGIVTATATAALEELAGHGRTRRATITATAANLGGLGIGTLIAGLLAEFAPDPTSLVFWIYLIALVPAVLATALVPETVVQPRRPTLAVRRPTLPTGRADRVLFLRVAAAVFAAFAVNALFSSLVPDFLHGVLHVASEATVGGVVALLFLSALVAQLGAPARWLERRWLAPGFLVVGVAVFVAGLWTRSFPVFVVGTVLAGVGSGLAFRRGIAVTARLADPRRRADLNATYFLAAYAGTIVPTLALGGLDQVLDAKLATAILAAFIIVITVAAAVAPQRSPARAVPRRPRS